MRDDWLYLMGLYETVGMIYKSQLVHSQYNRNVALVFAFTNRPIKLKIK